MKTNDFIAGWNAVSLLVYLYLGPLLLRSEAATNEALARATASIEQAIPRAETDPSRPIYHFHAPAQWMNDPDGPIYYRGFYHLFYQSNPYGDDWGHMHWGHARSRDLVHWQNLPIALWPSEQLGEEHVFSGCTVLLARGQPMIFYTSIARGKPAERAAEQWGALGDPDLITWRKHPDNPLLPESVNGPTKIYDWRDPFVFKDKGTTFMVLGGNLNERHGGQAVVNLYRAENEALTRWKYVGVLFTHPNPAVLNIECPNFFKLGEKWVLIISPHGPVEYFVGDFDSAAGKFYSRENGTVDLGNSYYAPNSLADARGRRMMWGWIKGFPSGHGWNGCFTVPRILALDSHNVLLQKPAPELKKLRTEHFRLADVSLDETVHELSGLQGDALEIYAELELLDAGALELQIRRSNDGARFIPIAFSGTELRIGDFKTPFQLLPGEKTLRLHLFLDRSVLEVYANDRTCITQVIHASEGDSGVALLSRNGIGRVRSLHGWKLRPLTY